MTRVTLWGTRGSLPAPGPETARWGGNTSCVEVEGASGTRIVLDAGTGIRRLGASLPTDMMRVDLLLTHLHMDHIQGLGFFDPLYRPDVEVHIWGPASVTLSLRARLARYMSPPLFPVHLRDLPCKLVLHEVPGPPTRIGEFTVTSALVCHPGPTVGYRIVGPDGSLVYLPDHEPALGRGLAVPDPDWVSGYALAADADLLVHDAQYTDVEYDARIGWGHTAATALLDFASLTRVKRLCTFHHDPAHNDDDLDRLAAWLRARRPNVSILAGTEGATFQL